jgi:hypothetical protein
MHTKQLAAEIGVFAPTLDGTAQALSEKIRMGAAYSSRMHQQSHDSSGDDPQADIDLDPIKLESENVSSRNAELEKWKTLAIATNMQLCGKFPDVEIEPRKLFRA